MNRSICLAVLLLLATWGCTDHDSPAAPTDQPQIEGTYRYGYEEREIPLVTSPSYLALRFRPEQSAEEIQSFLADHSMTIAMPADSQLFSIYVVTVSDAFAVATPLADDRRLEYVGPVFTSLCDGSIRFGFVGNQLIVKGDVERAAVRRMLTQASVLEVRSGATDPDRHVYEIPWGRAGKLFELCIRLNHAAGIVYAEPNFVLPICWGQPSP